LIQHDLFRAFAAVVPFAFAVFWLAIAAVHIAFALSIYRHSTALRAEGRRLVFVGAEVWTLATLVAGVLGATAYWLFHCSTVAVPEAAERPKTVEAPDIASS